VDVAEFREVHGGQDPRVEDFLEHHGVKGMHWGEHKSREMSDDERKDKIAKIQSKLPKFGSEKAIRAALGYQLRSNQLDKKVARTTKRNSSFSYKALSPAQQLEIQRKAQKTVTRKTVLKGSAQITAILAGGAISGAKLGKSPEAATGAAVASLLLAGKVGKTRAVELRSLHTATKVDKRKKQIADLTTK
jgi:hypothetical protein